MSGYFVYKVIDKDTLPLTQVHEEILGSLKSEKIQDAMQALQNSATPQLNDQYFGPAAPPGAAAASAPFHLARPQTADARTK